MTNQDLRDVLREALPQKAGALAAVENVQITNDADLAAFVRRVLERQDAVRSGQLRFTLGSVPAASASPAGGVAIKGVITEQVVNQHAAAGVLILAADAVLTPLGRDRARKLNLRLERRR